MSILQFLIYVKKEEKKERRKVWSFESEGISFEGVPITGAGSILADYLEVQKFAVSDKFFTFVPFLGIT